MPDDPRSFTDTIKTKSFTEQIKTAPFVPFANSKPRAKAAPDASKIYVPDALRFQHVYIPGKIGQGKSTLLYALASEDVKKGKGVTVIDPKGDLVTTLLNHIPAERRDDTVYLDLETPIPFDFLAYQGDAEKDELIEDLIFLLLSDAGNAPRAKGILYDILYTLFGSSEPVSFLDICRFVTDAKRHDTILKGVTDPELKAIWKKGIPNDEKLEPIMHRMKKYVRNSVLRSVFGTARPALNLADVINGDKILLVNLGGASRASIDYGSLLFQKMKQEVFRRHKVAEQERRPHYVYIDEFQEFANVEDFKKVLMMARGYKFGMTLANPTLKDLPEHIKTGIGVCGNYVIFKLPAHDIPFFTGEIPPITTRPVWRRQFSGEMGWDYDPVTDLSYLTKLPVGKALYHLAEGSTYLTETPRPPSSNPESHAEYIKKRTIEHYGCQTTASMQKEQHGDNNPAPTTLLSDPAKAPGASSARSVRTSNGKRSRDADL